MTPTPLHAFLTAHAGALWLALAAALVLAIVAWLVHRERSAHRLAAGFEEELDALRSRIADMQRGPRARHHTSMLEQLLGKVDALSKPAMPDPSIDELIDAVAESVELLRQGLAGIEVLLRRFRPAPEAVPEPVETPLPPASPPTEIAAPEHVPAAADPIATPPEGT